MTAIAGIVGPWPRGHLERECINSIEAQSLYSSRIPKFATTNGAAFAAALFETVREDAKDRQPLRRGPCLFVADVRLDNRDELLTTLNDPSIGNASADSEILLAAWLRWNHALFDRIIGSYAFALFDSENRKVVLARDPAGDRPLCYRYSGSALSFASMPSGLVDNKLFAPNLEWLADFLVHGDPEVGTTAFQDVAAVPPGHSFEWTPHGDRLRRFWRPPEVDHSKTGDIVEEFRDLLDKSVRCRLRRIGDPIATHLSAGLDSGAVTATAAALLPRRRDLLAFTMTPAPGLPLACPPRYRADESSLATELARELGIQQRIVSHSAPLLDCLRDHARIYQEPVHDVANHGWVQAIQKQAFSSGAQVLLIAGQGNASFSYGGLGVLTELLRQGRILEYGRQVRELVRQRRASWRGVFFYSALDYIPKCISDAALRRLPDEPADLFIRSEWNAHVADKRLAFDYHADGIRRDQFRMFAHSDPGLLMKGTLANNGLDIRDPSGDQRLIDFCLTLPAEQYVSDGVTRRLARQALTDRLPSSILENYVRGYQGGDWFAKLDPKDAGEWIDELSASHFATQILDFRALRTAASSFDRLSRYSADELRQWGNRFTRALSVGAFLRDIERGYDRLGRKF